MNPDLPPLIQQFADDLEAAVDKYRDEGLTNGEAIGAMVIAALNIWYENLEEKDAP